MVRTALTVADPASAAAGKPYVTPACRMSEINEKRSGAMRSSRSCTDSGTIPRIGFSPHDRGLRARRQAWHRGACTTSPIRTGQRRAHRASNGRPARAGRTVQIASSMFSFISGIWQIHTFREGNTRTTAVFAIMYLRRLGFTVDNTPFATHAQYFRDALVLDNTFDSDLKDPVPLQRFMQATLFDPSTPLPPLRHPNGVTESEPGSPTQPQAPLPDPSPESSSVTALSSDSYHGPSL